MRILGEDAAPLRLVEPVLLVKKLRETNLDLHCDE